MSNVKKWIDNKGDRPRKSIRYCECCEKDTIFNYNKKVFHCVCCECGNRNIRM